MSDQTPLPSYSAGSGSVPAGRMAAPKQVNTAFWLYIAVGVLSLIGGIIGAAVFSGNQDQLRKQLSQGGQNVSQGAIDAGIGAGIASAIVSGIVGLALYVLFAIFLRRGANWARIVLTVLTALSLIANIITLATGNVGLGLLQVILAVIATILIFRKPANEYFQSVKAHKLSARS